MVNAEKKVVKTLAELKPRISPIQARSEKTRAQIINAAIKIIDEQGIGALTTRRIAGETNIAIASVYRYFPNKEAILYAIVGDWYGRIIEVYEKYEAMDTSNMTWQQFFDALQYDSFFEGPEFIEGYRYWAVIENSQAVPELHALTEQHEERIINYTVGFLQRFGSTWPENDLRTFARLTFYLDDAASMLSLKQAEKEAKRTLKLYTTVYDTLYRQCFNEPTPFK